MVLIGNGFPPVMPDDLDGQNTSDIWAGTSRERGAPLFWKTSSPNGMPSMRSGDWKLHLPLRKGSTPELYNLAKDPAESENLAEKEPEVLAELSATLTAWTDELPADYVKKGKN